MISKKNKSTSKDKRIYIEKNQEEQILAQATMSVTYLPIVYSQKPDLSTMSMNH